MFPTFQQCQPRNSAKKNTMGNPKSGPATHPTKTAWKLVIWGLQEVALLSLAHLWKYPTTSTCSGRRFLTSQRLPTQWTRLWRRQFPLPRWFSADVLICANQPLKSLNMFGVNMDPPTTSYHWCEPWTRTKTQSTQKQTANMNTFKTFKSKNSDNKT